MYCVPVCLTSQLLCFAPMLILHTKISSGTPADSCSLTGRV